MLSTFDLGLITGILYGWLIGCVAWGRPEIGLSRSSRTDPGTAARGSFPWPLETLWLGSIAVVLLYPIAALLVPSIPLSTGFSLRFPGDAVVQAVGIGLVLMGGAIVGWAFRALGRFATVEIRLSHGHTIVRTGPYRWIRHPMYSANMLLTVGFAFLLLNPLLLLLGLVVVVLARVRAGLEERLFLDSPRLRIEYSAYRAETGRFFPRVRCRPRRAV